MGVVAFIGCMDEDFDNPCPISGTGKTCAMSGLGFFDSLNKKTIWSNYHTSFSDEVMGFQKMVDKIVNELKPLTHYDPQKEERPDIILLVTEMQEILNSCGSENNKILFVDSFAHQLRKYGVDLYFDTQRFMNIQKRLRTHTDTIFIPYKRHFDLSSCYAPRCLKPHYIDVYSQKPFIPKPIVRFNAVEVGKLYNTYQVVLDKIHVPTKKELLELLKNESAENNTT